MAAFGARLDVIDSPQGDPSRPDPLDDACAAAEIVAQEGGYTTDQFHNRDALDGYRQIGDEIAAQIDGPIAAFCAYVGVRWLLSWASARSFPSIARGSGGSSSSRRNPQCYPADNPEPTGSRAVAWASYRPS